MSSEEEGPVAWLRKEIGNDLAFAQACLRRPMWGTDFEAVNERIARCEAELAILDEHYILTKEDRNEAYAEFSVVPWGAEGGPGDQDSGCVTCHYYSQGGVKGYGICRTVRLLASGYKHRPGFPAALAVS